MMKTSPGIIIEEIEKTEKEIGIKNKELDSLNSKLTKLNIELAESTYFNIKK